MSRSGVNISGGISRQQLSQSIKNAIENMDIGTVGDGIISNIDIGVSTLTNRVETLESFQSLAETKLLNPLTANDFSTLNDIIQGIQTLSTSTDNRLDSLESTTSTLAGKVLTAEGSIQTLQTFESNASTELNRLDTAITTLQQNQATSSNIQDIYDIMGRSDPTGISLDASITQTNNSVNIAFSNITDLQTENTEQSSRMTKIEYDIIGTATALDVPVVDQLTDHNTRINTNTTNIATIVSSLGTSQALPNSYTTVSEALNGLQSQMTTLNDAIDQTGTLLVSTDTFAYNVGYSLKFFSRYTGNFAKFHQYLAWGTGVQMPAMNANTNYNLVFGETSSNRDYWDYTNNSAVFNTANFVHESVMVQGGMSQITLNPYNYVHYVFQNNNIQERMGISEADFSWYAKGRLVLIGQNNNSTGNAIQVKTYYREVDRADSTNYITTTNLATYNYPTLSSKGHWFNPESIELSTPIEIPCTSITKSWRFAANLYPEGSGTALFLREYSRIELDFYLKFTGGVV